MGRRYKNSMMGKKDIITYTVYENGTRVQSYVGDKNAAEEHAAALDGPTEIRKSRITVEKDS
jgi:hypothetical protein